MFIACNTSDEVGDYDYAVLKLTTRLARRLLTYQPVFEKASRHSSKLCCIQFFDDRVSYGNGTRFDISDDWVEVPNTAAIDASPDSGVTAKTMEISRTGITWSASPKRWDGYFQTEELSWDQLRAVASGECPFEKAREIGEVIRQSIPVRPTA